MQSGVLGPPSSGEGVYYTAKSQTHPNRSPGELPLGPHCTDPKFKGQSVPCGYKVTSMRVGIHRSLSKRLHISENSMKASQLRSSQTTLHSRLNGESLGDCTGHVLGSSGCGTRQG